MRCSMHGPVREPEPLVAVVLERREPGEAPEPAAPHDVRAVAEQAVPGIAPGRELPQRGVDLDGGGHLLEGGEARLPRRDVPEPREERPAVRLVLELGLPPLEPVARGLVKL